MIVRILDTGGKGGYPTSFPEPKLGKGPGNEVGRSPQKYS